MSATLDSKNSHPVSDRRAYTRRRISSLAYADLGMENGGIVLDLSEGGMAVQAVVALAGDNLPRIRFQLPDHIGWIETPGRMAWQSESKRDGGIEFTGLSAEARGKIRAWISGAADVRDMPRERRTSARGAAEAPGAIPARDNAAEPAMAASGSLGAARAEAHESAPLDLMVSTAEFSTPQDGEERQPYAVPSSAMVAPLPPPVEPPPAGAEPPPWVEHAPERAPAPAQEAPPPRPQNPRAPIGSIFDRENGPDLRFYGQDEHFARRRHNWVGIGILAIVLAVASFAVGMGTAQGSFDPEINAIKSHVAGLWGNTSHAEAQDSSPQGSPAAASSENASAAAPAAAPSSPAAPAAKRRSPSSQPAAAANSASSQTPANQSAAPASANSQAPTSDAAAPQGWSPTANSPASQAPATAGVPALPPATNADPTVTSAGGGTITIRSQQFVAIPTDSGFSTENESLRLGQLIHRVDPVYPPYAVSNWIEGTVVIRATTDPDGTVSRVDVVSGESRLAEAAATAVSGWRYQPTTLNGQPVVTQEGITFVFHLPHAR